MTVVLGQYSKGELMVVSTSFRTSKITRIIAVNYKMNFDIFTMREQGLHPRDNELRFSG